MGRTEIMATFLSRRSGWLVALAITACVFALALRVIFLPLGVLITPDKYKEIEHGMSKDQIHCIIGGPPGDYTGGQVLCAPSAKASTGRCECWIGFECLIVVRYDDNDLVSDK